jgi:hypothetical protein
MKTFHCVVNFDQVSEDFILIGIFTLLSDAEAFAKTPEAIAAGSLETPCVINQPLSWITNFMLQNRLGKLYDVLMNIEENTRPMNILHSADGLPLVVHQ